MPTQEASNQGAELAEVHPRAPQHLCAPTQDQQAVTHLDLLSTPHQVLH